MRKLTDWARGLLRPRLAVFTTQVRSLNSMVTMVAVRLTTTTERALRGHWRIEGPAAVELGKELVRLQTLWPPGRGARSSELDRARATMIANGASPRLAHYLGELSLA